MKIYKSYPKVNLFLKIVGIRENYHLIFSRFLRVKSIYDEIKFIPHQDIDNHGKLNIVGNFNFPTEQNIIYKIYKILYSKLDIKNRILLADFFDNYQVEVIKRVPMMAGLGGGSSNGATFLNMLNDTLNLNLEINQKISIVREIGSDIPFFLYDIESANVTGVGEIVEETILKENNLNIEIYTPDINCNTGAIYREFRTNFFKITNLNDIKDWKYMSSTTLFKELVNKRDYANDLFNPAKNICPDLENFAQSGFLFSGSGSSFFRINLNV